MSKKAQGMSLNTVVLLVLAVIVLVVIIAGFTMGWGNMWERVQGFFSKTNVDSVVATCTIQCTTDQKYEFCNSKQSVRIDKDISGDGVECKTSNNKIWTCIGNCNQLKGKLMGFDTCAIECP